MTTAESAEQYKELLKERRDLEAVLEFCDKRIKEIQKERLSPEAYKAATMEIQKAFTSLKEENRAAIRSELDKLLELFRSYDDEVTELNKINTRLANLNHGNAPVCEPQTIAEEDRELKQFLDVFYRLKALSKLPAYVRA